MAARTNKINGTDMSKQKKWESIVRSKLENFEVDTHPEDWNAILDRLPDSKQVRLFRILPYAAAVVAGLMIVSLGYFFFNPEEEKPVIADRVETEMRPEINDISSFNKEDAMALSAEKKNEERTGLKNVSRGKEQIQTKNSVIRQTTAFKNRIVTEELKQEKIQLPVNGQVDQDLLALHLDRYDYQTTPDDNAASVDVKKTPGKRWGIGMGGGSYSVGTDGGAMPTFLYPSNLLSLDSEFFKTSANVKNKQNVVHKRPVSFGIGIGYALDDRWSLQSGLSYTMLASEWWFIDNYQGVSKQKLHFLGIPLGVSYKIAEWKKIRLYASAGGMTEWNMSGTIKTDFYSDSQLNDKLMSKKESVRMSEWQWSVNGKLGVSYPLFKFVNAFAEGGANYYFDTGSSVETIRTDKPFHVSLQAGIRFGF